MTLREVLAEVEAQEVYFMGEKLGDSAHIIIGFEVIKENGDYVVNLLGQDDRSDVVIAKTTLSKWKAWREENNNQSVK